MEATGRITAGTTVNWCYRPGAVSTQMQQQTYPKVVGRKSSALSVGEPRRCKGA